MSESKHSPTPWYGDHDVMVSANGVVIMEREKVYLSPRNATHIIRCVNAHTDLLAACERVLRAIEWAETSDRMTDAEKADALRAAIEKAKP